MQMNHEELQDGRSFKIHSLVAINLIDIWINGNIKHN